MTTKSSPVLLATRVKVKEAEKGTAVYDLTITGVNAKWQGKQVVVLDYEPAEGSAHQSFSLKNLREGGLLCRFVIDCRTKIDFSLKDQPSVRASITVDV